jgi:uncharacterized membrane protein YphA (DoxX/SURF4 family)
MKQKIICIIIGIVFIASGIGKIGDTAAFGNLIYQYGFEKLQIIAPLIVLIELAIGICLILGIKCKTMSLCSFLFVFVFTIAFSYGYFKHGIDDCGCLGKLKIGEGNIWIPYLRNIILLGCSLFVYITAPKDTEQTDEWKKNLVIGMFIPLIFIAGFTFRLPNSFRTNKQHRFLYKNIKETALSDYVNTSQDSSYLIFLFSYTCSFCWNSVENYKHFKESGVVDNVVSIAILSADSVINLSSRNVFVEHFGNIVTQEIIDDNKTKSFVKFLPTSFYVKNDTIKAVIESELPSSLTFRYMIHQE